MNNPNLIPIKQEFGKIKMEVDTFLATITPNNNQTEVFNTVSGMLQSLDPLMEKLVSLSDKGGNTSEERILSHEIKDYLREVTSSVNYIFNPDDYY